MLTHLKCLHKLYGKSLEKLWLLEEKIISLFLYNNIVEYLTECNCIFFASSKTLKSLEKKVLLNFAYSKRIGISIPIALSYYLRAGYTMILSYFI